MRNTSKIQEADPKTGCVFLRDGMTVAMFLPTPIHESSGPLLAACEEYCKMIPEDALRWELVGANAEVWKPTNSSTLRRCRSQLSEQAMRKRSLTSFILTGSEKAGDAPIHGLLTIGNPIDPEMPDELSLMQMYFPPEVVASEHVERFVEDICKIASLLPFVSGYASPALKWSRPHQDLAAQRSRSLMMRYPGYDVEINETGRSRLGLRVRGARWLTFLGPIIMEKLGTIGSLKKSLRDPIDIQPLGHGVMVRAGKLPEIGDKAGKVGTASLCSVARALEPVTAFDELVLLREFDHDKEFLEKWERRFLD